MRFQHKREDYFPKGAIKVRDKLSTAVAYVYERNDKICAAMFAGKRQKPDQQYSYRTTERRAEAVRKYFEGIQASEALKKEMHDKRTNAGRGLDLGDVLKCSWGYDQTNVDFYQVTALIGKTMVEITPIAADSDSDAWMQGECTPRPGHYTGKPMRKRARDGAVSITSFSTAFKMDPVETVDGTPIYAPTRWTSYA